MSRIVFYRDDRITVVTGVDHMLGLFFQLYDKTMQNETSEGEGIILDWSKNFGYDTNLTGIPNSDNVLDVINEYIASTLMNEDDDVMEINLN